MATRFGSASDGGSGSFINRVYDTTIRPHLPPRRVTLGGVEAYDGALFDLTLSDRPEYEEAVRAAQREHVAEGDRYRVVGGGVGVTAVTAVRAGAARVDVAEASKAAVRRCRRTVRHHGLGDAVSVEHARVGPAIETFSGSIGRSLPFEWVAECDVLELDCEGAEVDILSALSRDDRLPRCVIVESHGFLGSPTERVRALLDSLGYRVVSAEPEVEAKDVMVLAAVRD